jgi:hypothetical protein
VRVGEVLDYVLIRVGEVLDFVVALGLVWCEVTMHISSQLYRRGNDTLIFTNCSARIDTDTQTRATRM